MSSIPLAGTTNKIEIAGELISLVTNTTTHKTVFVRLYCDNKIIDRRSFRENKKFISRQIRSTKHWIT